MPDPGTKPPTKVLIAEIKETLSDLMAQFLEIELKLQALDDEIDKE